MNSENEEIHATEPSIIMNNYRNTTRDAIIILTIGIGINAFTNTLTNKNSKLIMKLLSLFMYVYSLVIVINANLMLNLYSKMFKQMSDGVYINGKPIPYYMKVGFFTGYEACGWILSVILILLLLITIKTLFIKL